MDKNRVLGIYNDFTEGKFLSSEDRINLPDRIKKFEKFLDNNNVTFNIESHDNVVTESRRLTPKDLKRLLHPVFANQVKELMLQYREEEYQKTGDKQYANFIVHSLIALEQLRYQQAYKTHKASNDNVYIVTEDVFNYFAEVELPDDLTIAEIVFTRETPALFIFEKENTVSYLNYFFMPDVEKSELFVEVYGDESGKRYRSMDIVLHSESWVFDNKTLIKDYLRTSGLDEKERKYALFFYNIILFLASKDSIAYHSEELNPNIITALENIGTGTNVKRNEKLLAELPSFKFVDLALTIDNYTQDYYLKNPFKEDTRNYTPHWRTAHYQSYWYGKRDGSEQRRKELKFIPTIWVGNPDLMKDQTIFKKLKKE